jgi:HEAT repeat protein
LHFQEYFMRNLSGLILSVWCACSVGCAESQPSTEGKEKNIASTSREEGETEQVVESHLALLNNASADDRAVANSVLALKKSGSTAVRELSRKYKSEEKSRYLRRWSIVEALGATEHTEALPALADIAASPLPGTDVDSPEYEQEAMIRLRAISNLGALSKQGNANATEALRKLIKSPDASVRRAAAIAFVEGNRSRARVEEAKSLLPRSEGVIAESHPATSKDLTLQVARTTRANRKPMTTDPAPVGQTE